MDKKQSIAALRTMLRSRYFENKTEQLFKAGQIHGTTHLANGQEASQAGLCMAIEEKDWIVPTHRCHGFTVCKGSSLSAMFSEMFGSVHGLAKGLGGSMHMPDKEKCNLGSSAVVGSGVPLALGIAFYLKRIGSRNISVGIFGDGATSRGSIHESMNIASIWKLPILFYCENNHYGMSAPSDKMISGDGIHLRARAYNIESRKVDGNNFELVFNAVKKAADYIRNGNGPYFLEVNTYRQKGHSKSDKCVYRTASEEQYWLDRDPIVLFEKRLIKSNYLSEEEIKTIENEVFNEVEEAAETALANRGDILSQEDTLNLVFASQEERL